MHEPRTIPRSTYRLQFNKTFTFSQATALVPYLAELGVSHCYASPYLRARPGSMHGYDIVDHHQLNPEIGTLEDYERFVAALHQHGMGQILDIVPNHMGIMGSDNAWWLDVLENGEASAYAEFFDIEWYPLKDELQGKVLVPVLGDQYGIILDRGELRLSFDKDKGEFSIFYLQHRFPVNPREYPRLLGSGLQVLQQRLSPENEHLLELQSLISAFNHLPGREETAPEKRIERLRDKEIHKRRLAALCARSSDITEFLGNVVEKMNGIVGDPASFDALHELIKAQAYRLAFWRVAADDINYRRFFDINDLAALRQENESLYNQTHEFVLTLLQDGKIDGLRIDHPDGLYNPRQYFERLQRSGRAPTSKEATAKRFYVVAEKILTSEERIPESWPIHGTTGYNFSNLVNGLFIDPASERKLDQIYRRFTAEQTDFKDLVYECKKLVMDRSLNSELNVMANHLSQIALADRHTCDFTVKSLRDALTEIVACFPVYRTYVTEQHVSPSDRAYIDEAVDCAKVKNTAAESSVYDFIRKILLNSNLEGRPQYYQRSVNHFAMRFQQYTSALMAKGLEDTTFYRYNRLISLNEVGGDPLRFGVTPELFHREIALSAQNWPHAMVATSTHDSKRSEDVRARINVLSEMPLAWHRHVRNWRKLNRARKTLSGESEAPAANDEYLLYQTLVGAWPLGIADNPGQTFSRRICDFMRKAIREAKENTNWANPNQSYESAVTSFVNSVLESQEFRDSFVPFQERIAYFGMLNSLAQTLIKLTVPGVPDIYQGTELWEFSLVDPDNRREVDYDTRHRALHSLKNKLGSNHQLATAESRELAQDTEGRSKLYTVWKALGRALRFLKNRLESNHQLGAAESRELVQNMENGQIKLYTAWKALGLRKQRPDLFREGAYIPLRVTGEKSKHVLAFARKADDGMLITAVPRLCAELLGAKPHLFAGDDIWADTRVELPQIAKTRFVNVFTAEAIESEAFGDSTSLSANRLFANFPIALVIAESRH
jgi:(1->4)-alpha-D-glucan 1-alpha-D-glucosylmutase